MLLKKVKILRKRVKLLINKLGSKKRNSKLKNKTVTIISNNCFAGVTYEYLDLPYLSPTIGLYFFAPEYIKFIYDIKKYTKLPLEEMNVKDSKYYNELVRLGQTKKIIGKLGDIEIVFLHYNSFQEAKEKWNRRCKRINYENIIYKFNDQNLCTSHLLECFHKFPAKNKICFTAKKYDYEEFIQLKKYQKYSFVKEDIFYYHKKFDIVKYINDIKK